MSLLFFCTQLLSRHWYTVALDLTHKRWPSKTTLNQWMRQRISTKCRYTKLRNLSRPISLSYFSAPLRLASWRFCAPWFSVSTSRIFRILHLQPCFDLFSSQSSPRNDVAVRQGKISRHLMMAFQNHWWNRRRPFAFCRMSIRHVVSCIPVTSTLLYPTHVKSKIVFNTI